MFSVACRALQERYGRVGHVILRSEGFEPWGLRARGGGSGLVVGSRSSELARLLPRSRATARCVCVCGSERARVFSRWF